MGENIIEESSTRNVSSYRWVVLFVFIMIALLSQLLWLTFAPISSEVSKLFNVSAFDVSILSLVWPLIFVISSIPIGIFIDKKGFKISVGIGAIILAAFSIIRIFSVYPSHNFTLLLIAQSGAALSQPFIFSSITKLSTSWFPKKEQGLATGLGTIGLFIGMMLALTITPILFLTYGISGMLIIYAIISCIGTILFILLAKEREIIYTEEITSTFTLRDLWNLSKLKDFLILEYGFFAGVGGFTAIMTWLEEILHSLHGININEAGIAGGVLIIGGIIGAILIPAISDKIGGIKYFILADIGIGAVMLHVIGFTNNFLLIIITCFIIGFFLMSSLPLVLELSSRITGKGMEGRASSMLWFFSQLGSIVLIAVIEPIKSIFGSYYYSLALISILWIIAYMLFIGVSKTD